MNDHPSPPRPDADLLASLLQNHVPVQPWSRYGDKPVPLDIGYNRDAVAGPNFKWSVRAVAGLRGKKRVYCYGQGETLAAALQDARNRQLSMNLPREL